MNAVRSRAVVAVAATLVVAVLGGCGTAARPHEGADASVPSASSTSAVAAPTTVPPPVHSSEAPEAPSGAPGTTGATGLSSPAPPGPGCREGHCTVTVTPGEVLAMDVAKFGFGRLTATSVSADAVTVEATGPGIYLSSTAPVGQSSLLNSLDILVRSVTGHTAVLVLSVR
ncbi:hypothetical protein [Streptomyces mexicanus]|uniref:hypothetical protein n=1 Tax=Streptomyces mexicanus TaxID=178566 RepID=UPI00369B1939